MQAAKQAGMKVLGFIKSRRSLPENKRKLLKAGAFQVFFDMRALPEIVRALNSKIDKKLV